MIKMVNFMFCIFYYLTNKNEQGTAKCSLQEKTRDKKN